MLSMPVFDIKLLLLIQFFVYNSRIYCKHTSLFAIRINISMRVFNYNFSKKITPFYLS